VGLDTAIGSSGLPGAATLRRHGRRLGISTVRDLLTTFPRRYEDLRESTPLGRLAALADGTPVTARVTVASIRSQQTHRRRLQVTTAILEDESGEVEAVWFGRRFIERQLRPGDRVVVSGKVKTHGWRSQLGNPEFQRDDGGPMLHAGRIVPIYGLTRGVSARTLRTAIRAGLDRYGPYPEYLPASMVGAQPGIGAAMETAHFPDDFEQRDAAVLRLRPSLRGLAVSLDAAGRVAYLDPRAGGALAVLEAAEIHVSLEAWLLGEGRRWLGSSSGVVLVTGPSRTADIEMTLTIGVHGPKRVVVFLAE